jgi:protein required for attachment to host cells
LRFRITKGQQATTTTTTNKQTNKQQKNTPSSPRAVTSCIAQNTDRKRKEKDLIKMDAVQNLPPYKQQEFMQHLEQMQLKDSLS